MNQGYLDRSPDGQKYRLGLRLASLGSLVTSQMNLRRDSLPYLNQLSERFEETCDLSIFDNGEVLYIEVLRSNHALSIAAAIGQRLPCIPPRLGRCSWHFLPPEERAQYLASPLPSFTTRTVTSLELLNRQFEEILEKGYAWMTRKWRWAFGRFPPRCSTASRQSDRRGRHSQPHQPDVRKTPLRDRRRAYWKPPRSAPGGRVGILTSR